MSEEKTEEEKAFESFVEKLEIVEKVIDNVPRRFVQVPIKFNGKDEFVLLKKLGWAQRERLRGKFVSIETEGKELKGHIDTENFKQVTLMTTIYTAPFPLSNAFLDSCEDFEMLDMLFSVSNKINKLNLEKK